MPIDNCLGLWYIIDRKEKVVIPVWDLVKTQ